MTVARAILVVDDELESCRNLSDIFTDPGYLVDVAACADSAIIKALLTILGASDPLPDDSASCAF